MPSGNSSWPTPARRISFLEAIRQVGNELGRERVMYVHLTLLPWVPTAGELKTKPTQHSVKELREIGIQPDAVLCRTDAPLPEDEKKKIALFTNLPPEAVISVWDVDSIYKIPSMLHQQMLDEIVCHKLGILARSADLSAWDKLVYALEHPKQAVTIALVGKYVDLTESYKSLSEALIHAGIHTCAKARIHYIDSENIEKEGTGCLANMDAILVPGGFGKRGVEGKIQAIRFARDLALRVTIAGGKTIDLPVAADLSAANMTRWLAAASDKLHLPPMPRDKSSTKATNRACKWRWVTTASWT